jgi:pyroglutamyl-peptidase
MRGDEEIKRGNPMIGRCVGILLIASSILSCCFVHTLAASEPPVVLVTGFTPFLNYTLNPSGLIAQAINGSIIGNATVIGLVLPVDFNSSVSQTILAIEQYHPVLIISTGLDAKTHRLNVEKISYNVKRYQKEDGTWSFPRRIDPTGPFVRISPLHTYTIAQKIRNADIPVQQSFFTGTYVCNSLFYQVLGYVSDHHLDIPVGFIHVPLLDSQDPDGMPLQQMVTGVDIAIQTSLAS